MTSQDPILIVWPEYPPAYGGIQVHGVEFARYLHRNKVPFLIVTKQPSSPGTAAESREIDSLNGFSALRVLSGDDFQRDLGTLQSLATALNPSVVFSSQVAYAPAFEGTSKFVCRSAGNDILRPWIGPHDISSKLLREKTFEEQRRCLEENRKWVRSAARKCHMIICNSKWTEDRLRELGIEELCTITGGVRTDLFRPVDKVKVRAALNWDRDATVALIVARHVLKKGIDIAIEAIDRLRDRNVKLMIVGDGPEKDNLRSLSHELDVTEQVTFLGVLPHAVLPRYVAAADMLLMPSRSIYDPIRFAIDHETMGRTICEAAACEVPVVASRSGGIPSVVRDGETGLLVPPNNVAALAEAIVELAESPARASKMGKSARLWAEESLSFEVVSRQILEVLSS